MRKGTEEFNAFHTGGKLKFFIQVLFPGSLAFDKVQVRGKYLPFFVQGIGSFSPNADENIEKTRSKAGTILPLIWIDGK